MANTKSTKDNSGPVVLITGCSDGSIGHAMAREFLSRGCTVIATDRSLDLMKVLQGEARVLLRQLDVRSEKSIREAVESVLHEFGRIDVLVNNAGVALVGPLIELPMDSFDMVFDINVYGPMRLIQAVVPQMIERREGKIVNIGSIASLAPGPWHGAYAATKSALHALTDSLRLELRSFSISVMAVAPGYTQSNFANSSMERYNKMPEWRYYKQLDSMFRDRVMRSQDPRSTHPDMLAKKIVGWCSTAFAIRYYLPLFVRDFIYGRTIKC